MYLLQNEIPRLLGMTIGYFGCGSAALCLFDTLTSDF